MYSACSPKAKLTSRKLIHKRLASRHSNPFWIIDQNVQSWLRPLYISHYKIRIGIVPTFRNRSCPSLSTVPNGWLDQLDPNPYEPTPQGSLHKYTGMLCSWPWFTTIQAFTVENGNCCFNLVSLPELFNICFTIPFIRCSYCRWRFSLKKTYIFQPAAWITRELHLPIFLHPFLKNACLSSHDFSDVSIARSAEFRTSPLNPTGWTGLQNVEGTGKNDPPRKLHPWMINLPNTISCFLDVTIITEYCLLKWRYVHWEWQTQWVWECLGLQIVPYLLIMMHYTNYI